MAPDRDRRGTRGHVQHRPMRCAPRKPFRGAHQQQRPLCSEAAGPSLRLSSTVCWPCERSAIVMVTLTAASGPAYLIALPTAAVRSVPATCRSEEVAADKSIVFAYLGGSGRSYQASSMHRARIADPGASPGTMMEPDRRGVREPRTLSPRTGPLLPRSAHVTARGGKRRYRRSAGAASRRPESVFEPGWQRAASAARGPHHRSPPVST